MAEGDKMIETFFSIEPWGNHIYVIEHEELKIYSVYLSG